MKILELFAGYGSQALALKRLAIEIDPESEIVEWGVAPMIAYHTLNGSHNDNKVNWENYIGMLSNDTKKPAKTISKGKREAVNKAIAQTNNGVDVTKYSIQKQFDLLTYSFPCQDISNQGSQKGFEKGSGTRSGLLWEVERMLNETEYLPKYLLMENVKALVNKKNMANFQEWIDTLTEIGYKSEWVVLNSKDFGVPQNRERVFMLSVLEDNGELDKFKELKNRTSDCKLKDILMSKEELKNSPWPISEKDLHLNEFDLIITSSGNYKMKNFSTYATNMAVANPNLPNRCIQTRSSYNDKYAGDKVYYDGKIRMLRPLEKARLMGLKDEEFWKLYNNPALSQNEIEAMLGNSIVVDVLEEIFKCLIEE